MLRILACTAVLALPLALHAQVPQDWRACMNLDDKARLACFDGWAAKEAAPASAAPVAATANPAAPAPVPSPPAQVAGADPAPAARPRDCRNPTSRLAGTWELDTESSCGVLGIRSYRPMSLSVIASDSVNKQPTSDNPANTATTPLQLRNTETRIQLSVRSKLARGLFVRDGDLRDSIWFGYTQQSYWQIFTRSASRPFRNTDHEPEFIYVAPLAGIGIGGWKVRYAGLGLVHQSNGQSLPFSRSWNRVYLMAGAENARGFSLQGRVWARLPEDASTDDNPRIGDFIGRAELTGSWATQGGTQVQLTYRNNLRDMRHGSLRAEWLEPVPFLSSNFGSMRLHTQLFTGYGDSLIDFNRRRTVLSIGVSLVDW